MSPIELRVIAITACVLRIDPRIIDRDDSFVTDLGAESIERACTCPPFRSRRFWERVGKRKKG